MFTDPERNVLEFGFTPGQKVADFGSGAGHYAVALSKSLGESGAVYAIDLSEDMLVKLKSEALKSGRGNIEVVHGDIEKPHGTKLRDGAVDGVIFSNILFQLGDKLGAVREAVRILRPGGKVCVVEWADLSFLADTLKASDRKPTSETEAKELFITLGLNFERKFEAGEHHYGLIFKKPLQ
ncbi:class I SAM-dependent methyltransferase [Candidatus Parcubacteria bacterium]|nr:class I SAM-dependent methyltransferase [Candidatus Parcubacteria bacterium]